MKSAHPFIEGFRRGLRGESLTPSQGQNPRTVPMLSAAELRKLSATYSCSVKTLRRLLHRGIDISDPSAVACALAGQRNISTLMAEAVLAQLETNPSND